DTKLLVLGLLKGSFIFLADLVRQIPRPLHVDFLVASSYGSGTVTSGEVRLLYDPEATIEGRHVILVEDIIDSGTTLNRLVPLLRERKPASLELCALLHKRVAEDLVLEPRWVGFDAPREFLVGYGLDHAEDYRHLHYIASLRGEGVSKGTQDARARRQSSVPWITLGASVEDGVLLDPRVPGPDPHHPGVEPAARRLGRAELFAVHRAARRGQRRAGDHHGGAARRGCPEHAGHVGDGRSAGEELLHAAPHQGQREPARADRGAGARGGRCGAPAELVGLLRPDAAVAAADRHLVLLPAADAGGRLEGVPVRQVEGAAAQWCYGEGHVRVGGGGG